MSEIKVDKISPQSGTALQIGDASDVITIPASATITNLGTATGFGLYASIAIICDQKAYNATGGTLTAGAWRTRDLNTEISDADGIVSISTNQFTLGAGTYTINWQTVTQTTDRGTTRLYNITDTSVEQYGITQFATGGYTQATILGKDVVTISGAKAFEIQHYTSATSATYGFGVDFSQDSGAVSIFTIVEILKHS